MEGHSVHEAFGFLQRCPQADESLVARLEFEFLPFLDRHSRLPWTLQHHLAKEPGFFVECLKILYRRRHRPVADEGERSESARDPRSVDKARRIWQLLRDWRTIPGADESGSISLEALRAWVRAARQQAREADRLEVCDVTLGELFARSPADSDHAQPLVALREVIEECESAELERGLAIGFHNLRGFHFKAPHEGGQQERELAAQCERYAEACARWPRTAAVLRGVAKDYRAEAEREDERARARD
jgi:hypothetical protein